MKNSRLLIFIIMICSGLNSGCQSINTPYYLMWTNLQHEIKELRSEIEHDLNEVFVKKRISSISTSSIVVAISIEDLDTCVEICIFDTCAPCNMGREPLFEYSNCLAVNDGDGDIYICDKSNSVILFTERFKKMKACETKTISFTDGIFRQYYYRDGNLIPIVTPQDSGKPLMLF